MAGARRYLVAAAVLAAALWPLGVFFAGRADTTSLAPAPYLRSLALASLTALGSLALGLPAAWGLASAGRSGRWLCAGALAVLLVPPYLAASAWMGIAWRLDVLALSENVLAFLPGESEKFRAGWNLVCAALVLSFALWPCAAFPAAAALAAVGREEREAALLARGRFGVLAGVDLPAALPPALGGALVTFALAWAELGAPDLFLVTTASRDILKGFEASHDFSRAAGRSLPLAALAAGLAALLVVLASRRRFAETARARLQPLPASLPAGVYAWALLAAGLGATLGGLALNIGKLSALLDAVRGGFEVVAVSLSVALLAAAAAVLLAAALVWALWTPGRSAPLAAAIGALSLSLLVPGTLWGLGFLRIRLALPACGAPGAALAAVMDSPLGYVWAAAARAVPGAALVLLWGRRRLNDRMLEAARVAGVRGARRAWLAAGLLRGYLVAALLVGAALALGELGAAVMIRPPGCEVLSVRVFNAMHNGHGEVTAALALVTAGGATLFGGLAAGFAARR